MESVFKNIKNFLLEKVNPLLEAEEDEEIKLPLFSEKYIVFGQVDLSRYQNKIIVSVIPEDQEEDEEGLDDYAQKSRFLITFLCSGDKQEKLVQKICRYSECFRIAVLSDALMNGTCDNAEIGKRKFYCDAGAVSGQMAAVEIELTVLTSTEI